MFVYVLSIYWNYEGSDVIGVYTSREAAEVAWEKYHFDGGVIADSHNIMAIELDAAASKWGVWG